MTMRRWLRALLLLALAVAVLAAAAIGGGLWLGDRRAARTVQVAVTPVAYRDDAPSLERGRYLYGSRGCADCHGADGGGRTLVNDGKGTHLAGPNLTAGNPKMARYTEVDWVRSIRHGVAPSGRVLRLMPSEEYHGLSDDDLAALVAHVRSLPSRQGREHGVIELPLPARVLYGFGAIPEAYERIDHALPPSPPLVPAISVEYGRYVATMCTGCHGATLMGGRIVGAPPDWPPASQLRGGAGSVMPRYADRAAFVAMLRSGKRPDGSKIAVMPFEALGQLNDTDAAALHAFLVSLAPG